MGNLPSLASTCGSSICQYTSPPVGVGVRTTAPFHSMAFGRLYCWRRHLPTARAFTCHSWHKFDHRWCNNINNQKLLTFPDRSTYQVPVQYYYYRRMLYSAEDCCMEMERTKTTIQAPFLSNDALSKMKIRVPDVFFFFFNSGMLKMSFQCKGFQITNYQGVHLPKAQNTTYTTVDTIFIYLSIYHGKLLWQTIPSSYNLFWWKKILLLNGVEKFSLFLIVFSFSVRKKRGIFSTPSRIAFFFRPKSWIMMA